ncbi:protein DMP2-like [Diospyros lotus]|uniref:protein DMP2-like n=1 Tax=Diospyros lotus TaxID=55363 RepID=UPI0022583A69|nr:protein DMP2-like [Diospyros lotus]
MGDTTTTTPASSSSSGGSSSPTTEAAFSGLANIIKLLPTGTVLLFQFLNPVLTNNGQCSDSNKSVAAAVIALCGLSCFVSSFTDSYEGSDGRTHYGFVTLKGIRPSPAAESVDLSAYKIGFGDFVHAAFSVMVFAAVSLLDSNTVECFYPSFQSTQKSLVMALPPVIGAAASTLFAVFPNKRHGIGYASSSQQNSNKSSSAVGPNQNESTPDNNQSSV